jgi:tetratricopeptide (TPR) repeat protein
VNNAGDFIKHLEDAAEAIKNDTLRSKKYRAGIATLAQKAVDTNNTVYLDAAEGFTQQIIDTHDRSKAFVDIIRATARIAGNTSSADLLNRALALSAKTETGHDRSHCLQGVAMAMGKVGITNNDAEAIEASKQLAYTIEYDTYRSSALRGISRTRYDSDDTAAALEIAEMALDVIDKSRLIKQDIYRVSAYVDLTALFLEIGEMDKARQCIVMAQSTADNLEDEFERSSMFQAIAETLVRMGARTKDRGLLEGAVQSYSKVTREYYRTSTRRMLNNVLRNLNETELLEKILK